MTPLQFVLVVFSGVIAGIVGTIFGIGGGLILVPILVLGFHLPMHQAVAASIIAVIATSSVGASIFVRNGMANVRLGVALEVTTTAGAISGGLLANSLDGAVLQKVFAVFLIVIGTFMWLSRSLKNHASTAPQRNGFLEGRYIDQSCGEEVRYGVRRLPAGMVASLIAGQASGMMGVGGGIIKVPVMNLLCGIPLKAATATSNFMIGVTALASAVIYFSNGHVNPYFTASAILGVLGGSLIGTHLAMRLRSVVILFLFILLMYFTAVRMFFS